MLTLGLFLAFSSEKKEIDKLVLLIVLKLEILVFNIFALSHKKQVADKTMVVSLLKSISHKHFHIH